MFILKDKCYYDEKIIANSNEEKATQYISIGGV